MRINLKGKVYKSIILPLIDGNLEIKFTKHDIGTWTSYTKIIIDNREIVIDSYGKTYNEALSNFLFKYFGNEL